MTSKNLKATIYLVRHAECVTNETQKLVEPFEDVLTKVGKTQAELLGKSLSAVPFTRAYASDYPRTMETGQLVLKQSKAAIENIVLIPEKRLRERDYTGMIPKKISECVTLLTGIMKNGGTTYLTTEIPESETVDQFEARIKSFFSELIQELRKSTSDEETILLVSHGLTIQRLIVLLNQNSKDCGVDNWTRNTFSEKLVRNTTFHQLLLEIPKDGCSPVSGRVEHAHIREHVKGKTVNVDSDSKINGDVSDDGKNYSYMDERKSDLGGIEDEIGHFCRPV